MSLSTAAIMPYRSSNSGAAIQIQNNISSVAIQPAPHSYRVSDDVSTSDLDNNDLTDGIFFSKLFMLRSNLSVCEGMYVGRFGVEINDPRVFALKRMSQTDLQNSAVTVIEDRMVVSGSGSFDSDEVDHLLSPLTSAPEPDQKLEDQWTVDSESLYGLVTEPTSTKSLTLSSLTLDEEGGQLSLEQVRGAIDGECTRGSSGIKSL